MKSLNEVLKSCFWIDYRRYCSTMTDSVLNRCSAFMSIPVSEETIEIPVLAFMDFMNRVVLHPESKVDVLAVSLSDNGRTSTYKTVDTAIRDVLECSFPSVRLVRLPQKDASAPAYYCSQGVIFDASYTPLVMLSWKISRDKTAEEPSGNLKYVSQEAILRISPRVFTHKDTSVERYIVNRIIPAALSIDCVRPIMEFYRNSVAGSRHFKIRIDIADCPFPVTMPDVPSVSTTNEELLDIALDNLDELVQQ